MPITSFCTLTNYTKVDRIPKPNRTVFNFNRADFDTLNQTLHNSNLDSTIDVNKFIDHNLSSWTH